MAALLPTAATAGVRNAADVMLKIAAAAVLGPWGPVALGLMLLGGAAWLIGWDVRRSRELPRPGVFAVMLAEAAVLSVIFGMVVGVVTARLLGAAGLLAGIWDGQTSAGEAAVTVEALPLAARVMLSLGAGLYEELVFRVLLVGGIAAGARSVLGLRVIQAGVLAAVLGALIFSAFHYVGYYGDVLQLHSFAFRFIAGLAFSGLYLWRGFGITAWTHALYDVLVLVLLS